MQEDFVQYVWKFKLFKTLALKTRSGKDIEIVNVGIQNHSSGPDFSNAKIKIDGQLWVGNVEIHLSTKDWNLHKHQEDAAYNNVILHVVYFKDDDNVKTASGRELESLFLEDLVYPKTEANYNELMRSKAQVIPCEKLLEIEEHLLFAYYDRLILERLERKIEDIEKDVALSLGDLDKAFLISLFKYFGAPQNKEAFEILARNIDLKHIIKQAVSIENLEALLLGTAGFLDSEIEDEYKNKLENEFSYLKQLYRIDSPMHISNWKFSGVRPPSFPTIRIAQLAAVLFKEQRWFSYIQNEKEIEKIREKMQVEVSSFWKTHYNFGVESKSSAKSLTDSFLDKIMINVMVPFLFYYGKFVQEEKYIEKAQDILLIIKPEKNNISKQMSSIGFSNKNALESQALLELKNNYCNLKKCLDCRLGYRILKNKDNE